MPTTFQISSYLRYWLDAVDKHSLHSPFFFDFYTHVLRRSAEHEFASIEALRKKLLSNKTVININDLGAGSAVLKSSERMISDIAQTSLSSAKFSKLYATIINFYNCKNNIELGTSLGINALFMASNPNTRLTTFEGSAPIASFAQSTIEFHGNKNIVIKEGDICKTLPEHLQKSAKIDLAFMDANHRYEPTVQYAKWLMDRMHPQSILILDDIHASPDMERAWKELKDGMMVYASVDLYRCGILFFNPSLNKQHVVLQF
jgi:predicted O-methyltransferase YrrM